MRDFDSSGTNGSYPGYTHQRTVDVLKYDNIMLSGTPIKTEIKFLLSNQ